MSLGKSLLVALLCGPSLSLSALKVRQHLLIHHPLSADVSQFKRPREAFVACSRTKLKRGMVFSSALPGKLSLLSMTQP